MPTPFDRHASLATQLLLPAEFAVTGVAGLHASRVLLAMAVGGDAARALRGAPDDSVPDLAGRRVMICEDEPMIGYDLAFSVVDAGGEPIGPIASVSDALNELDGGMPDAAILDVNLIDGDVTPVLQRLIEEGVTVVVNTGTRLPEGAGGAHVPVFIKPTKPEVLIHAIGGHKDG